MSKQKQPRRLADNEAKAMLTSVKTSPQKAGLVMRQIRGMHVEKALATLMFSPKAVARDIKALLESAIANAENNHDLNVDNLFVKSAVADKSFVLKRWRARARGRGAKILKPRAHLSVIVAEKEIEKKAEAKKASPKAESKAPAKKAAPAKAKKTETKEEKAAK